MTVGADETLLPPSQPAAPPEINPFQRMAGVLLTPVRTFADIALRPDFMVPLVLMVVISFASVFAMVPRIDWDSAMDAQFEQMKKQNPNLSQEDFDRISKFSMAFGKAVWYIAPILSVGIYALVAGALLLGVRMFGGEGTYKQAFAVTIYAFIPAAIIGIIRTIVVVAKGSFDPTYMVTLVKTNPAFLVNMKEHMVLFSFLSSIDIFTIWLLALLIIGFASVAKFTKTKTAAIIIPMWLLLLLIKLGFAAIGAARMKA